MSFGAKASDRVSMLEPLNLELGRYGWFWVFNLLVDDFCMI